MGILNPPFSKRQAVSLIGKSGFRNQLFSGSRRQIVASRGQVNTDAWPSSGSHTSQLSRIRIKGGAAFHSAQVAFSNFYAGQAAGELTTNLTDISIRASIEMAGTPFKTFPLFFNGKKTLVLEPGAANVFSDPVGADFPSNFDGYIRIEVTVADGGKWPSSIMSSGTGEASYQFTGSNDQVYAAGALTNPSGGTQDVAQAYFPSAILGVGAFGVTPAVLFDGDSIINGSEDAFTSINRGFVPRGLASVDGLQIPWARISRSAERSNLGLIQNGYRRRDLLKYATHYILGVGTNDIVNGLTLAQTKGFISEKLAGARRAGLRVGVCSVLPRLTPASPLTPVSSMVPETGFELGGIRDQLNTWIAAGCDGLSHRYLNTNQYVQDPSNPDRFALNATTDRVHPEDAWHALMAQEVTDWLSDEIDAAYYLAAV